MSSIIISSINIKNGTPEQVVELNKLIPEFDVRYTIEKLKSRLHNRESLILIACDGDVVIGYKLGYSITPQTLDKKAFYSWLGGVIPAYRNKGVANQLREYQEGWAKDNHYQTISVKSMNRFPAMLCLLLNSGYKITGYENNGDPDNSKICFTKQL